MLPEDREWLRKLLNERMDRHQAKEELTRELLRRSREALSRSEELLRQPTPFVWHPKPPSD